MKKGFTLIELLVVIAIIGILASVVLASLHHANNPQPCSDYANEFVQDIPARCVQYFQNPPHN